MWMISGSHSHQLLWILWYAHQVYRRLVVIYAKIDVSHYGTGLLIGQQVPNLSTSIFPQCGIWWNQPSIQISHSDMHWIPRYNSVYDFCINWMEVIKKLDTGLSCKIPTLTCLFIFKGVRQAHMCLAMKHTESSNLQRTVLCLNPGVVIGSVCKHQPGIEVLGLILS